MSCGCDNQPPCPTTTTTTERVYDNPEPCSEVVLTDCVEYYGPNLPCLGISNGENLTSIIGKVNAVLCQIQANLPTTTTTTTQA